MTESKPDFQSDVDGLAGEVRGGNRRALARAITLVESTRADHRVAAVRLLELLSPHAGGAMRVGISGVPGVGKTESAKALASVLGRRLIRLQCYEGIDSAAARARLKSMV